MSTHHPRSSASSRPSSAGGVARNPDSRSVTGSGGTGSTARAARAVFARVRVPCCPPSRYGVTPPRVVALAQVAAAIDTDPWARPNWASMAEWLEGMSPYSQRVAVRGVTT